MHLDISERHQLRAAQGWLELGNHLEANEELEKIAAEVRAHPDVLQMRWEVYAKAKQWLPCVDIGKALVSCAPARAGSWIKLAFALHELKRTNEAWDCLRPAAETFPNEWTVN